MRACGRAHARYVVGRSARVVLHRPVGAACGLMVQEVAVVHFSGEGDHWWLVCVHCGAGDQLYRLRRWS